MDEYVARYTGEIRNINGDSIVSDICICQNIYKIYKTFAERRRKIFSEDNYFQEMGSLMDKVTKYFYVICTYIHCTFMKKIFSIQHTQRND